MKKIVIDARELRTSSGRYVERLLHHLQDVDTDLSHRYYVLLTAKDFDGWTPRSKRFVKVQTRYKEFTFGEQLGLAWQIYRLRADLVHFAFPQQPILYLKRTVTTIHDLTTVRFVNPTKNKFVFWVKQNVYSGVIKLATRTSHTVIAISEYTKQDIAKFAHLNSRKIVVTYEGADQTNVKPEIVQDLVDKQFILYIGRPQPHKNLRRLIDAFVILKQKNPELILVLAGKTDAMYKKHERYVQKHDIPDVVFTGFVSDGNLRWMYENCRAYVFPSLSEGFGLPSLEAMHQGAPVIASTATCIPEINGDAPEYFDPFDIDDIARKIHKVNNDDALRKKMISRGKKQANKYSWERMAQQTLAVYKDALGEK